MQQNEYLLAKIGVDTAENEPLQVWGVIQFNIHSTPELAQFNRPIHRAKAQRCATSAAAAAARRRERGVSGGV